MKKLFNNMGFIFTALQVCSVIAILPAVYLVIEASRGAWLSVLTVAMEGLLWAAMWLGFLLMCGRLKREPSAFTRRNARTLLLIAVCCGAIGVLSAIEAFVTSGGVRGSLFFIVVPGSLGSLVMFFGVAAVALVLRRLLQSAMALQRDSDLTI